MTDADEVRHWTQEIIDGLNGQATLLTAAADQVETLDRNQGGARGLETA